MVPKIVGWIGTLGLLYFLFDFFFWDRGFLAPSILTRISEVTSAVIF